MKTIRNFFDSRNFLSVDTPHLAKKIIPEAAIEVFRTSFVNPSYAISNSNNTTDPSHIHDLFLLPSPEYYLKQLLCQGVGNIYEITHCFRNGESCGKHHAVEFSMLEYYQVDANNTDMLQLTRELLQALGYSLPFLTISMQQAFLQWTGIDLDKCLQTFPPDPAVLINAARAHHINVTEETDWQTIFYQIFLNYVEPALPKNTAVFITQYPSVLPTLAAKSPNKLYANRWELYLDGIEIANCFDEETDSACVQSYLHTQHEQKQKHSLVHTQTDFAFLQPPQSLPLCSGVALGVDRLLMHRLRKNDINDVMPFSVL